MTPEQFLPIADCFPDAALLLDKEGRILAANRALAELGHPPETLAGRRLTAIADVAPEKLREQLRLWSRSRQPVFGALDIRSGDGSTLACRCHGALVHHDPGGSGSRILLRLSPREASPSRFAVLTQKIDELTEEIRRRRQTEERLHDQTEWLTVTLSSIGDAVLTTDRHGLVTFLNPEAERLTGWRNADAAGRALAEVFHIVNEQTRRTVESPVDRVLREGIVVGLANHTVLIAKDGRETPIDDSAAPIRRDAEIAGVVLVFRDVTERKAAEESVREQARVTETLYRIGKSIAAELDLEKVVQTLTDESTALTGAQFGAFFYNVVNERGENYTLYTISGVDREAFAGLPMPRNTGIFEPTFRGDGPVRLEDVTQDPRFGHNAPYQGMPAGHLPVRSYLAVPVVSRSGEVLGGLFFGHAEPGLFTERHERIVVGIAAQATVAIDNARLYGQVKETEGRLSAIVDHSPAVIFLKDRQGRYLLVNRRYEELAKHWGIEGPIIGKTDAELFPPVIAEQFLRDDRNILESKRVRVYEESTELAGEVRTGLTTKFPLLDDHREAYAVCGINLDITEQRRAREALEESEERFRQLAEHISKVFWVSDAKRPAILYVSPAYEQIWGRSCEELYRNPRSFLDAIHADDRERVIATIQRQAAGETTGEEYRVVRPDGSIRWVFDRGYPVRNAAGEVYRIAGIAEDITERKLADETLRASEARLRESEERLRLALEAGRMGVWDWNIRTGEVKWSDNLEALHGLPSGGFGGTFDDFQKLIHPADRKFVADAITRAVEDRSSYEIEFRNLWPDASVHWIVGKGKVLTDRGEPTRMVGVGLDITDRKKSEQDARFLADASAALAGLVDYESTLQVVARLAVPHYADWCSIDMLDDAGMLRRVAVAHIDPAKVQLAHELHRRFPPDSNAPNGAWQVLRSGKSELTPEITDALLVSRVKDKELLEIIRELGLRSAMTVPLSVRGKVLGVISFISAESGRRYNFTDLATAEDLAHRAAVAVENGQLYAALKHADRRKDEFLATLAHELRNPLAPIRSGLEVLKLSGEDHSLAAETQSMMQKQLEHMVRLIDDLLEVSRITRGKFHLRKERVDLQSVIHSAVEATRPLIGEAGHRLTTSVPQEPIFLNADPTRLSQVLSNLLGNAAKYTDRGGDIWLSVERRGGDVAVIIRDTGIGIPREHLASVFEMFSQVDSALERSKGGLGIGLSLVRALVEMHGGTVEARSEGLGTGSEFIVRLPVLSDGESDPAAVDAPAQKHPSGKSRVLVVDDNHDAARSLAMLLKIMGNEVATAHDGMEAVQVASTFQPRVVLLDIGMPKMNGYEVARRIREAPWGQGMTLIAVTGWGQEEDKRRAYEAGFNHHLTKPIGAAAIAKVLALP
jgi:PAS domain S-box-containing protein